MNSDTRQASRAATAGNDQQWETINVGSLQRIADACEKISASWTAVAAERDKFRKLYEDEQQSRRAASNWRDERIGKLERRVSSLRGVITRMKAARKAS